MQYQNQNQSPQSQTMDQPPAYISTKDLHYLKDAMAWELTAMKKCHHFAKQCNDTEMKQVFDEVGRMHQTHYEILLSHVDPNNTLPSY